MNKRILLTILTIFIFSIGAMAHGPKKIQLTFNKENHTLSADIIHKVKNIEKHYISNITIYVNGEEVLSKDYEKQLDKGHELVKFDMEQLKDGDIVKLTAKCNKFGKKSAELTI
ncbi:MAG: hypothetical protein GQ527_01440 [Bacteroidales bacterium]|nr:hypothetical protein [Bacteroidales bacterium]